MSLPLRAKVTGGRIELDDPSTLPPEGTVLKFYPEEEDEDLDEEERKALHAAIEEGIKEADAGETVPVEDLFAEFERRR